MPEPITPDRIIPAGEPLPARPVPSARPLPPAPPGATDLPPWRTAAPAPGPEPDPPEPDPGDPPPIHVHVTLHPPGTEPEPEPSRWDRLTSGIRARIRPWQAALALTAAVLPIPGVGYSAATIWAYTVGELRADHGARWGYAVACGTLAAVSAVIVRRGATAVRLWLLTVALIGAIAVIDLFDPIQALTGVRP